MNSRSSKITTTFLAALLAGGAASAADKTNSAWSDMVKANPQIEEDSTIGPMEESIMKVLTTSQLEAWQSGKPAGEISLSDGTSLEAFMLEKGVAANPLAYVPVTPCTVFKQNITATNTTNFDVTPENGNFSSQGGSATGCGIPSSAVAVLLNTKSTGITGTGRVSVFAQGALVVRPIENFSASTKGNNALPIELCSGSCASDLSVEVAAFTSGTAQVLLTVHGYFEEISSGGGGAFFVGGGTAFNGFGTNDMNYIPMNASGRTNTYDGARTRVPAAGTLTGFSGRLSAVAGSGGSYVFTVIKNGASQSMSCTVSGDTDLDCEDLADCVSFATGDNIAVNVSGTSATNVAMRWNGLFTPGGSCSP